MFLNVTLQYILIIFLMQSLFYHFFLASYLLGFRKNNNSCSVRTVKRRTRAVVVCIK